MEACQQPACLHRLIAARGFGPGSEEPPVGRSVQLDGLLQAPQLKAKRNSIVTGIIIKETTQSCSSCSVT